MITANKIFFTEWPATGNIILYNDNNNVKYFIVSNLITKIISYLYQKFGDLFMFDYDHLLIEFPIINNILFDSTYIAQESLHNVVYELELLIHDLIINFIQNKPHDFSYL